MGNGTHLTIEETATVAAAQATEATAELLRFAREGAHSARAPFGEEVVGKLAEALGLALEIEGEPLETSILDENERALLANLKTAVAAFINGWFG